jgi:hypothetical protein
MNKEMDIWLGGKNVICSDEKYDAFQAGWLAATKVAVDFCLARKGAGTSDECAASIMSLRTEVLCEPSVSHRLLEDPKQKQKDPTPRNWIAETE